MSGYYDPLNLPEDVEQLSLSSLPCDTLNPYHVYGLFFVIAAPKAYSYIRFSTPEQQAGDSFRRQTELSKAYAEANGLTLDERLTYRDLGVSAFDKSNVRDGQLGAFLSAIDTGTVAAGSFLLVESLDRISRAQISDALEIFMSILNRGITIVTLADGMEYSKAKADRQFTDLIISIAIMSRAHEESLTKSKRLKEAWKAKRANTDARKLTALAPGWLQLSDDKSCYVEIPERVKLIKDIFIQSKNGIGMGTIAKRLNQQGVPTFGARAKNLWHQSYITKILENRSVLGEFQPHIVVNGKRVPEGDPIKDYFPRIVTEEDFASAMTARKSRRTGNAGRKGASLSNLFSGIVKCGYCNGSMTYVDKGHNGPRSKLLVCAAAKAGKDCHYVAWEYQLFEKSVLAYCNGLDFEQFIRLNDNAKSELTALSDRIAVLTTSIANIEAKELNILQAIESGAKFAHFEARAKQLEQERSQLEIELRATKEKYNIRANAKIDLDVIRSSIEDLLRRMSKLEGDDLYDLRALLSQQIKRVIARIKMYPGGYIEKKAFIEGLCNHLKKTGYKPKAIEEYIATKCKTKPDPSGRFFTMASHNASIRTIQPNANNPEILNFEMPHEQPIENMKLFAESMGTMIQALVEASAQDRKAESSK